MMLEACNWHHVSGGVGARRRRLDRGRGCGSASIPPEPRTRAPALRLHPPSGSNRRARVPVQVVTAPAAPAPAPERALSANPLWAHPAHRLVRHARPADLLVIAAAAGACGRTCRGRRSVAAAPPKPREPERPQLSLVGTIAGGDEGFGIFLDQSTKAALRLKIGEDYQGWKLRSVQGREATLEKDQQAVTLALPQPGVGTAGEPGPAQAASERPSSAGERSESCCR